MVNLHPIINSVGFPCQQDQTAISMDASMLVYAPLRHEFLSSTPAADVSCIFAQMVELHTGLAIQQPSV